MNKDTLTFVLETKHIDVVLESTDGKTAKRYQIRELLAVSRDKVMDSMRARTTMLEGGKARIDKFEGLQSDLLMRCMFDEEGKAVPPQTIQNWPASVVQKLYEAAEELNAIGKYTKTADEESKKE